ncbi:hypothetical protein AGMMS49587_09900 [Spirochaetia bacterium]|nr:hypothetical protein AGMMS49587_09900 [Spirochaetia bacterium]
MTALKPRLTGNKEAEAPGGIAAELAPHHFKPPVFTATCRGKYKAHLLGLKGRVRQKTPGGLRPRRAAVDAVKDKDGNVFCRISDDDFHVFKFTFFEIWGKVQKVPGTY